VLAVYNPRSICKYFRKQGANIGDGCVIYTKFLGAEPYLVSIGNNVWIADGVAFHTHDGGVAPFRTKYKGMQIYGPIVIDDNCMIGRNVQLLPNVRIGKNSMIGAGSVVISEIPPDTIAMGVPARPIGSVSKYEEKCLETWKIQRPPNVDDKTKKSSKKYRELLRRHLTELYFGKEDGDGSDNETAKS
jgi:acetyltransferase-like isoleucine patch superfamily enzyme